MDDVEAAGAEPEVARLDVDDTSSPTSTSPDQRRVGPGRRDARPPTSTVSGSISTTVPRRSFSIARLTAPPRRRSRRSPRRPRASRSGARAPTLSAGCGWPRSRWRAGRSRTRERPARWHRCRRRSRPRAARSRSARAPRARVATAGELGRLAIAAEDLGHVDVDVAAALGRRPRAGVDHRRRRLGHRLVVERARLALDPALARDDVRRHARRGSRRRSPSSRSSSRPSGIAPIAAAAASIAECPSSGRIPACASSPSNSATSRW